MALRRALFKIGLRYRVNVRYGRGTIDVAFTRRRVAIFCDGCFWHRCPDHGTESKRNGGWWAEKLQANVDRDCRLRGRLEADGWMVIRVWEHEDADSAAREIKRLLKLRD